MGRFFASILLLCAACGDNLIDPTHPTHPGGETTGGGGNAPSVPRYVPEVCGVESWSTSIAGDLASQVAVMPSPGGATVLAVPTAGGALTGFVVDDRLKSMDDGTEVAIDDTFTQVSAAPFAGHVIVAAVDSDYVRVNVLDNDLSNPLEVAKLPIGFLSQQALFTVDGSLVMPIADADGLTLYDVGRDFAATRVTTSSPATGLTAVQLGAAALAAWSSTDNCYVAKLAGVGVINPAQLGSRCGRPQLAANGDDGSATLVYETGSDVRMIRMLAADADGALAGGATTLVRPAARAPRVMFDGERYWVSYIDSRGDIAMGFVDGDNHVESMALEGVQPQNDAYQLALIGGAPWVFSLDAEGYTAHKMCITTSPTESSAGDLDLVDRNEAALELRRP